MSARNFLSSALAAASLALPLHAQTVATRPSFEVASIKRNLSGDHNSGSRTTPGGRLAITNEPLREIIQGAYGQNDLLVVGGPAWIDSDKWDISAIGRSGNADEPTRLMMQSLLADRFKLVAHMEKRDQPVFALVLARSDRRLGSGIHPSSVECKIGVPCGTQTINGVMTGVARTMTDLARSLYRFAERRVIDQTGLTGRFDFEMKWMEGESVFTAIQEQLGLKLEAQRAPVDVVVVDSVERAGED